MRRCACGTNPLVRFVLDGHGAERPAPPTLEHTRRGTVSATPAATVTAVVVATFVR
ncbi:MAG: hypothetical protein PGN15_02760 [Aeromicrobium erythreum]